MHEQVGYPTFVLYLILLIGIPLAIFRSYAGFLFAAFVNSAADSWSFVFTRTSFLGPYFNAHDACFLVAIVATIAYAISQNSTVKIPSVIAWMIAVLLISFAQSVYLVNQYMYEIVRSMRWAITLPVYFIISAAVVDDEKKVKQLLITLFLGSIVSAVEHIVYVRAYIDFYSPENISAIRTIAFRSPGLWLLLSVLIWQPKIKGLNNKIMIVAGTLFVVSVLLNQTRSIWISSILVIPLALFLFRQRGRKALRVGLLLPIVFVGVFVVMHYLTPSIDPGDIVSARVSTFTDETQRYESTYSRQEAFEVEINDWLEGTLIFGRGLCYFAKEVALYWGRSIPAYGHLGHVTTLSQLGLIGLFVYSIYFPIKIVQASRKLWNEQSDELKFFGLFAGLCMIWCWICFFMSDSFLSQHAVEGIIFGAVWRQASMLKSTSQLSRQRGHRTLPNLPARVRYSNSAKPWSEGTF